MWPLRCFLTARKTVPRPLLARADVLRVSLNGDYIGFIEISPTAVLKDARDAICAQLVPVKMV